MFKRPFLMTPPTQNTETCFRAENAGIAEGPATPPPEDQEFEDDDGTIYQWDRKLRKFQPKDLKGGTDYKVEDMTFEMDEEAIPALQMPKEVFTLQYL